MTVACCASFAQTPQKNNVPDKEQNVVTSHSDQLMGKTHTASFHQSLTTEQWKCGSETVSKKCTNASSTSPNDVGSAKKKIDCGSFQIAAVMDAVVAILMPVCERPEEDVTREIREELQRRDTDASALASDGSNHIVSSSPADDHILKIRNAHKFADADKANAAQCPFLTSK